MNNKVIGLFIKSLREQKQLSQQELADILFVDRTLVSKWESGSISLTGANLKLLADYFEVSADEILSGEKINKDNKNKVESMKYIIFDENTQLKRKRKTYVIIFFIILFVFLTYFFLTFYNSVKIYKVDLLSQNIAIDNGLFIKTKDEIMFRLDFSTGDQDIEDFSLFYMLNGRRYEVYKTTNSDSIIINDNFETQKYFNFSKMEEIISNMFLEINYNDERKDVIQLEFQIKYSNSKLFFNKIWQEEAKSSYFFNSIMNKYHGETKTISIADKTYEISINSNSIDIMEQNNHLFIYKNNINILNKNINNEHNYWYNYLKNICVDGKCDNSRTDYELFYKILNDNFEI